MMTNIDRDKSLTVYKASAGSGKTFTLSLEYIKLLIRQPYSYRNILAVTFTNKATEEMKFRILSQLYGIWKNLPDSKNYTDKLISELHESENFIHKQSGIALINIIHDYSYFRIETIDSFFQSILRNLARELDLTPNLRIELNDYKIEQTAVDQMIEELNNNDLVLKWILSYIKELIKEDKNWNVIGKIKKFGENIFKDFYKTNSKQITKVLENPDFYRSYIKQLQKIKHTSVERIKEISHSFHSMLDENGISIDEISYGSKGVCSYFIKLSNEQFDNSLLTSRVIAAMDDPEKWVKKNYKNNNRQSEIRNVVITSLYPFLINAESERKKLWKNYKSADLTLKHMNQLRLLNHIEQKVRKLNIESNSFLLSDTQTLLHGLISKNDTPFIYEKIGTQIDHIMIDEFQDTGKIQWKNFKVLLDECMGHTNNGNLIVGDVKQSIYRWRSGDWRLLNNIESEFANSNDRLLMRTLDTNYRSCKNIVDFNNAFFTLAANYEYNNILTETNSEEYAKQLKMAYTDVQQYVPTSKKNEGLIQIELLPKENYQSVTLELLKNKIEMLLHEGITQDRIAIIVRSNKNIEIIANYFTQTAQHINIVSDEAFRLGNSISVNIIINALRLLVNPRNKIAYAYLAKSYQKHILGVVYNNADEILISQENGKDILPKKFTDNYHKLINIPIYNLVENIYSIFNLEKLKEESSYVSTFYDYLYGFIADSPSDIESLLEEWDNSLCNKTIQANEVEGIRLITIHKSKGLEYDNVLIPFCDWNLENVNTIWCTPKEMPYSKLPLIPIDYSAKQMKGTIFENFYKEEFLQNCVDNLNLLYVAFTRASHNLFVFGSLGDSHKRSYIIEKSLSGLNKLLPDSSLIINDTDKCTPISYSYGNLFKECANRIRETENIFLKPVHKTQIEILSYDSPMVFRQSNHSKEFINNQDAPGNSKYIKQGSVFHKLFSYIKTVDDIERAVKQLDFDGVLYDTGMSKEQLINFLQIRFKKPLISEWFSSKWKTFNECNILYYNHSKNKFVNERPDRVMTDGKSIIIVDFKFGNSKPQYYNQVKHYLTLITQMGYNKVKGYLWYVYSNKIEEVK